MQWRAADIWKQCLLQQAREGKVTSSCCKDLKQGLKILVCSAPILLWPAQINCWADPINLLECRRGQLIVMMGGGKGRDRDRCNQMWNNCEETPGTRWLLDIWSAGLKCGRYCLKFGRDCLLFGQDYLMARAIRVTKATRAIRFIDSSRKASKNSDSTIPHISHFLHGA